MIFAREITVKSQEFSFILSCGRVKLKLPLGNYAELICSLQA
ncbi:MAG: hypothetical protein ABF478_09355 [Liquorilactobacillus satsumensis]